jgi:hypothetical protein
MLARIAAQLGIVEAAGHLFAVTGDEGHGGAFVEQPHGGGNLLRTDTELLGDTTVDIHECTYLTDRHAGRSGRERAALYPGGGGRQVAGADKCAPTDESAGSARGKIC